MPRTAEAYAVEYLNAEIAALERQLRDMLERAQSHGCESENYGAHYSGLADGIGQQIDDAEAERTWILQHGFRPGDNRHWIRYHLCEAAERARNQAHRPLLEHFEYMCMLNTGNTLDLEG